MFTEKPQVTEKSINSPETTYVNTLLFHGAKEPFQYSAEYQFSNPSNDGSFTLGEGIYLTDKVENALCYSEVRQRAGEYTPIVYSVFAENCKFLDFRGEDGNVPVPNKIVQQWQDYFHADLETQKREKPDLGPKEVEVEVPGSTYKRVKINREYLEREDLELYLAYLDELALTKREVDIRELLGTAPTHWSTTGYIGNETAPMWSKLFRRFVTEVLKYDGLIALEGAEGNLEGLHPSYVVYNLDALHFAEKPINAENT